MIEIKNLVVSSFKKDIIKNITHTFKPSNNITAIIGKNGAGKSTFAKALCQLIKSHGDIKIEGINLKNTSDLSRARMITFCEELSFDIQLNVSEVLAYARIGFNEDEILLKKTISDFDLEELLFQSVSSLSGGERQRLSLACAFYQDAQIVFLDEPTNYLDPKHVDNLIVYLKNSTEKRIFIISHDINFLLSVSHDFFALKNGELAFSCDRGELIKNRYLDDLFDKKFHYGKSENAEYVV